MSKPTRTARCAVWVKAALLLTATLAAPAVLAQAITSSLSGRVVTPAGKGVAEAVIEAVSIDDGALRTALTDPQGRYRLDLLRPGRWNVVASTPDGNRSEARQVELGLQQTVRLDFVVLTGLSETITVQATPPLVDPQRSWGEVRVGAQQTDHLPVAGRTVTDLALLDSSVVGTIEGNFFGERSSVFVLNGQSGRANAFLVDGLDNGDRTSSTTLNSFFSQQVIDEFVVLTQQYAPEYGRAAGGVLNIITRRGNNDVSGELFVQGTTSSWNSVGDLVAGLPGATSESAVSRDAMGLAIGGPLKKDRAFYFVSFERQRADDAIPYTGIDRDGIAGGVLQAPFESDNVFLRTDFHLSPSNLLMLRISADKRKSKGLNVGGVYTPETGSALEERDWQLASSLQTLIRPDLTNEVRVLVGGSSFEQQANSIRPGVNRPSGIFGGNPLNAQDRDEERFQLVENLTWTRGAHRLKFGIDVLHTKTDALTTFHPQGNFLYETDRAIEFGDIDCSRVTRNVLREKADENKEVAEIPELGIDCRGEPGIDDDGDGQTDEPLRLWTYPVAYSLIDGRP
ncbi:MAG: TonB-dependent receptor, partial [Acidobacteriota bacterium]